MRLTLLAAMLLVSADDSAAPASSTQSNVGLALSTAGALEAPDPTPGEGASSPAEAVGSKKLFRRPEAPAGAAGQASEDVGKAGMSWWSAGARSGVLSLAAVLGLIGGLYWVFRRAMPGASTRSTGAVAIMTRMVLSPKHSVALLRVGRRRLVLVGIGPDRMVNLSELTDPDEVAELGALTMDASAGSKRFERELGQAVAEFDAQAQDSVGMAGKPVDKQCSVPDPARSERNHVPESRTSDARARLESLLRTLQGKSAA